MKQVQLVQLVQLAQSDHKEKLELLVQPVYKEKQVQPAQLALKVK